MPAPFIAGVVPLILFLEISAFLKDCVEECLLPERQVGKKQEVNTGDKCAFPI